MKKSTILKLVICAVILVIVLSLVLAFTLCDKSAMIADVYRAQGMTVCNETLENSWVHALLDDVPEEQLKKVEDYEILYAYVPNGSNPIYRAVIIVCPSAHEAKQFLKSCGDELYEEKKEDGMIQGNCILFAHNFAIQDVFKNYLITYIVDKVLD